jgi:hypothetical protein
LEESDLSIRAERIEPAPSLPEFNFVVPGKFLNLIITLWNERGSSVDLPFPDSDYIKQVLRGLPGQVLFQFWTDENIHRWLQPKMKNLGIAAPEETAQAFLDWVADQQVDNADLNRIFWETVESQFEEFLDFQNGAR